MSGIESISAFTPSSFLPVNGTTETDLNSNGTAAVGTSNGFGDMLLQGIDSLEALTDKSSNLAVQAATGDLDNIHDYTIAASEAQLATQLTVAVRDKALAAFQQIMQMQV